MSALRDWWREIDKGKRTAYAPWDALHRAACQELNDLEMNKLRVAVRIQIAELQAKRPADPNDAITAGFDALERWRRIVLGSDKRRAPLDVAAAWELTAAECERLGNTDAADEARAMARAQLKRSIA